MKQNLEDHQETIEYLINSAISIYGIDPRTPSRKLEAVWARAAISIELRSKEFTLEAIGSLFDRDSSTIIHITKKHDDNLFYDIDYKNYFLKFKYLVDKPKVLQTYHLENLRIRVSEINHELQSYGKDWDFIESFWKSCIEQAKNQTKQSA